MPNRGERPSPRSMWACPSFVFNVAGGQRIRLVQIKIQLMVRGYRRRNPGQTEYSPHRRHLAAGLQLGDR